MSTHEMPVKMDEKMDAVLDAFDEHDGYATTGALVNITGFSRPTVTKRLDRLYAAGCVEYADEPTAFWQLVEDPRDREADNE